MNQGIPRRDLFRAAGSAAATFTAASYSRILGANDTVQLGLIGCGERGTYVMQTFQKNSKVTSPRYATSMPRISTAPKRAPPTPKASANTASFLR